MGILDDLHKATKPQTGAGNDWTAFFPLVCYLGIILPYGAPGAWTIRQFARDGDKTRAILTFIGLWIAFQVVSLILVLILHIMGGVLIVAGNAVVCVWAGIETAKIQKSKKGG